MSRIKGQSNFLKFILFYTCIPLNFAETRQCACKNEVDYTEYLKQYFLLSYKALDV